MSALGNMFLNGYGVPRDKTQARDWFERAVAAGDVSAVKALAQTKR
jgi:TPR repeat protein